MDAECKASVIKELTEAKTDESNISHLDNLRADTSELKVPFDKVRAEINSKFKKGNERMDATEKLYQAAENMTNTLEQKYTNASNEQKEWKDVKVKLAKTSLSGKVTLNIGGDRYTTSIDTLTHEKDTRFTELFDGDWEAELDEEDKSIFFDRNGQIFTYILEYLRTDVLSKEVINNESLLHTLMMEAEYFHLKNLINILKEEEAFHVNQGFSGGTLLQPKYKIKLNEFYGKNNQRWELIYKASRDGFDANAFHTRCDNQGPTMTIIQSNNGYFFGGYTAVPWTSSGGSYQNDPTAFLFTITNPNGTAPTKFPVKSGNIGNAVYHHSGYGPTFGSGHALHLANGSNGNSSSYTNFPGGYTDTIGHGNNTFTGGHNFTTTEIEVFKQV